MIDGWVIQMMRFCNPNWGGIRTFVSWRKANDMR